MTPKHLKHILHTVVIAALPATLQVGCTTAPLSSDDPCRGSITQNPTYPSGASISKNLPDIATPLSVNECIKLCHKIAEQEQVDSVRGLGIVDFTAKQCTTKPDMNGGQQLDCIATFTRLEADFTGAPGCYAPPRPKPVVAAGRMPVGLHIHGYEATSALGQYFAQMTAMESAAVTAFRYLARELEAYQAPAELIQLARQAIGEEIEHAQLAGLLSQAFHAKVPRIEVEDFQLRSLFEIALENAIEGCVNETFAAACGVWQSAHAELDAFRAVIGRVTEDEIGHAALSWAIHDWAMPQLTQAEQVHIRQAQAEAVDMLAHNLLQEEHPTVRRALGLPETAAAARLFQQLRVDLWNPRIA